MTDLPFADYQQPTKPAAGPRLAIVGEAPGAEEARLGRPFVGRSGKLLDENLAAAGVERAECLVANVFRHQPPGNKVGHFFSSRTRARKEGREIDERWGAFGTSDYVLAEFSGEIDHLREALAAFAPRVVVALGRTPTWALTGRNGIMQLRGSLLPCRLLDGVEVVPTFHPSYILRGQLAEQPTFLADLKLAVSRLAG
ncbi:uracil-DNA glycosylase [Azospirillum thermophilum]|uniref:Uracil-DNA glycosylase n=1 Tax=Azospirillum thermophilum TaxID=2202148 RepID=A0A2S2CS23_9PROT|nr:uracil-DNA glycosylase [Azospirillum thermophilum]AWK87304.1 uracil-DNA glycosylase [Azospirillum thermophilum]